MKKSIEFIQDNLNEVGFFITLIGTIVGVIALFMTIAINIKTNNIQKNIKLFEVKANFNYIRLTTLKKLQSTYTKFRESGDFNLYLIEEAITELEECEVLYLEGFNDLLKDLKSDTELEQDNEKRKRISKAQMELIIKKVHRLITRLESNINVIKEETGETKNE